MKGSKYVVPLFKRAKELKILPIVSIMTKIEVLAFPKLTKYKEKIIKEILEEFQVEGLTEEIVDETIKIIDPLTDN